MQQDNWRRWSCCASFYTKRLPRFICIRGELSSRETCSNTARSSAVILYACLFGPFTIDCISGSCHSCMFFFFSMLIVELAQIAITWVAINAIALDSPSAIAPRKLHSINSLHYAMLILMKRFSSRHICLIWLLIKSYYRWHWELTECAKMIYYFHALEHWSWVS